MRKAERVAIGHDLVGMARMLEALCEGLHDHEVVFARAMGKKERVVVGSVVGALTVCSRRLRTVGNRMTQVTL